MTELRVSNLFLNDIVPNLNNYLLVSFYKMFISFHLNSDDNSCWNFQDPWSLFDFCHFKNKMAATIKKTIPPITEPMIIMNIFSIDISERV